MISCSTVVPVPNAAPSAALRSRGENLGHLFRIGMANVVVDLCKVGHDVRRSAAAGDDVVDARVLRHVLAHEIGHVVHGFDAVERRAATLGRAGRMGGQAMEAKFGRHVCERAPGTRVVTGTGMPVKHGVNIPEQPLANHVDLARTAFFGRRSVHADRARFPIAPANP